MRLNRLTSVWDVGLETLDLRLVSTVSSVKMFSSMICFVARVTASASESESERQSLSISRR